MAPQTIETDVQLEGLIQVRIPDALEGRRVRVTVEEVVEPTTERVFGRLKGMVEIMPSFKDPIPGFE